MWVSREMDEKKNIKICFAASSGGHYEQLMMLKPLMEKYDSFVITEKTDYSAEAKGEKTYYMKQVNRREKDFIWRIGVVVLLSGAVLIMGVILNESVIELLCRIAFWAPMLQWLFETVKMLNDDLENLNELDAAINSKEEKSMEDLQDIQKLIYEHRKGCLTIPNFFYGYFKDNDEDRAHRMANM